MRDEVNESLLPVRRLTFHVQSTFLAMYLDLIGACDYVFPGRTYYDLFRTLDDTHAVLRHVENSSAVCWKLRRLRCMRKHHAST